MDRDEPGLASDKPATGCFFYIVSPNPSDKNRRYVQSIERPPDHISAPKVRLGTRALAKPFVSLGLCHSYCDFLNRVEERGFVVVME